jgi:hypothetical protein
VAQPGGVAAQVVGEQAACRRRRCRRPRPGRPGGRAGRGVQQHREGGQARAGVADDVVDLDEHADPALRQPGQEPHLPQRPGPVQAEPPQLLGGAQQRGLVTGSREREDPHVIGEVEGGGVHP